MIQPGIRMATAMSIGGSSPYPNNQEVSLEGPIFKTTAKQKPIIISQTKAYSTGFKILRLYLPRNGYKTNCQPSECRA